MPTATLTNRTLHNKDTGIDLTVPSYKEIPGTLTTKIEYHVVIVSRLQFFKTPKHKESDIVQYMLPKRLSDFENLRYRLEKQYPGTVFPLLPKMALMMNEGVLQGRRNTLDFFVRFLASTTKLCTCSLLMEFLGVSAIKAGKFRKGDLKSTGDEEQNEDLFGENRSAEENEEKDVSSKYADLFGEVDEEETDLFTSTSQDTKPDIFISGPTDKRETTDFGTKLFEDTDLGGGLKPDEEHLFLIPDAKTVPRDETKIQLEDHSDLLNIEDNLDELLSVTTKPKQKPPLAVKPKPRPSPKPRLSKKPTKSHSDDLFSLKTDNAESSNMDSGDILKYIQENTSKADEDLHLF